MNEYDFREINNEIVKYFNLNICNLNKISKKGFLGQDTEDNEYFIKKVDFNIEEKYKYLRNTGLKNIIFPISYGKRTKIKDNNYILLPYLENNYLIKDMHVLNLYKNLREIHEETNIKKQLTPEKLRPKFEEITRQLDYKFKLIEEFIRSVESKEITFFSMPILSNYRYILDAKKELVRLQKLIIVQIKDRISVDYSIIHNNPKLDHLINSENGKYLISIDNSRLGVSSLDMAKLYIETEHLDVDFKTYIVDYYYDYQETFYYDYFRFLILFIYIKRLKINNIDYVSAENFINTANSIKKYFEIFLDKQEQVSYEQNTNN